MHRRRLAHHETAGVVERGEDKQIRRGVDTFQTVAVVDISQERHAGGESQLLDLMAYLPHGVPGTDHEEVERLVFDERQRVKNQTDILLPNMLAYKEEHGFIGQ